MASETGSAQERLTEVVAAAVEVAAEAGESGTYSGEVARTLTALVIKVGARIAVDAEVRGFTSGWQEAVHTTSPSPLAQDPHHARHQPDRRAA
ncbi:hypothetical protein [Streptomyces sp. NPDC006879]|uniref:hypothetical protein n=1 Tax=Streptomyces sp. NPDC006879 TaxID=3364767 RepID=UPI00369DD3DD